MNAYEELHSPYCACSTVWTTLRHASCSPRPCVARCQCVSFLDNLQKRNPSCKRQSVRLAELAEWGVEFRTYSPPGGGFAAMHNKVVVEDSRVLLTGSVNLTHNGLENNEENLIVTTAQGAADAAALRFDELWSIAAPLGQERLQAAVERATDKAKRGSRRSEVEKMD